MSKIKNLFQKLFGKKAFAEKVEEIDYPICLTEIPGLVKYGNGYILTSPMKYALRRPV